MVFCDDKRGIISFELVDDHQLDAVIKKLLADGYWVRTRKRGDKVLILLKEGEK